MNGKARWVRVSWMAGAVLPLVAGLTSAANLNNAIPPQTNQPIQQDQQVATSPDQTAQFQPKLEKAKDLIGAKVFNDKGEQLGTIADVVLTADRSAINYVVLSHDGTWGAGGKYFAVPWSQFSLKSVENARQFILTGVSKADLDRAPGFDKNHWPATVSANWLGMERGAEMTPPEQGTAAPGSQAYTAPGTSGNVPSSASQPVDIQQLRLSKLLGMKIQGLQGEDIGRLDNVMIDLNQGKVAYGIVAMRHGFLGMNKDFAAVPWSALNLTSQPGVAKLNADRDTLAAIAFNRDNFPNLADPQYSRQLFDRFHVTPYWETPSSLGYIPGEENQSVNPPSAGMTAPNMAAPEMIAHHTDVDKHALTYNPNAVETIHGTVRSVDSYRIAGTSMHGVLLRVRTDDGRMLWVQTGPRSWLDRQNITFRRGEPVTITGSVAGTGRHETVVASQIQTPGRVVDLRTPEGTPLWSFGPSGSPYAYGGYPNRY